MAKSVSRAPRSMVAAMRYALAGPLLLLSTAAFTQEVRTASSDSSVTELQEVVVTGIRKSLEDALDDKRNARRCSNHD